MAISKQKKTAAPSNVTPLPQLPPEHQILTETQVAQLLDVKEKTLRDWRKRRGLPFIRISSKVIRYRWSDVLRWLNDQAA